MRTVYFQDEAVACHAANEIKEIGYPVYWTNSTPKQMDMNMPSDRFRTLMNNIFLFNRKNVDWKNSPDIYRNK